MSGFDLSDRVLDQLPEFVPLFVRDCGFKILDLDQTLSNEDDLGNFGDARQPGVADELRIEGEQSVGLFRIPTRSGLPFQ